MKEEKNNNVVTAVIITILVMVVLGLVGFIVYDKVINKTNEHSIEENNKVENNEQEKEEVKPIEVTKTLEKELRELIPTYCSDEPLYKQYNGSVFKSGDLTEENSPSNAGIECQGMLHVYTLPHKNDSTKDEVYLYDYVLIFNQQWLNHIQCDNCSYGKRYDYIDIPIDDIEYIDGYVSEKSLKEYGQVYKYTFKLVDGNYEYVSTEAVK